MEFMLLALFAIILGIVLALWREVEWRLMTRKYKKQEEWEKQNGDS